MITEAWTKIQKSCWKYPSSSLKYDSVSGKMRRVLKLMTSASNWPKTAISSCQHFLLSNHMILNVPPPSLPIFFFRNKGLSLINAQQKMNGGWKAKEEVGWESWTAVSLNRFLYMPVGIQFGSQYFASVTAWRRGWGGGGGGWLGAGFFILCSPKTVPSTQKLAN